MNKNYRKIYEEHYQVKIPKGFEIHHIDLDHENNDPENLLMLPKKLHHQYHFALLSLVNEKGISNVEFNAVIGKGPTGFSQKALIRLLNAMNECEKWLGYRDGTIYSLEVFKCIQEAEG